MAADIKPGTTMQAGDVTFYAANARGACVDCVFRFKPVNGQRCNNTNCQGVVWLTQHNYLVRLLTS